MYKHFRWYVLIMLFGVFVCKGDNWWDEDDERDPLHKKTARLIAMNEIRDMFEHGLDRQIKKLPLSVRFFVEMGSFGIRGFYNTLIYGPAQAIPEYIWERIILQKTDALIGRLYNRAFNKKKQEIAKKFIELELKHKAIVVEKQNLREELRQCKFEVKRIVSLSKEKQQDLKKELARITERLREVNQTEQGVVDALSSMGQTIAEF